MIIRTTKRRKKRYSFEKVTLAILATACLSSLNIAHAEAIIVEDAINVRYQEEPILKQDNLSMQAFEQPSFEPVLVAGNIGNYDLRKPSNISIQQADELLEGTRLEGLGKAYVEAEKTYNVNALYLIAHSALESGWGNSSLAINKNNLFGITAYDGDAYDSGSSFKTKEECILWIANYISNEYLNKNGEHYNGSTLKGMNVKYASDREWAGKISEIMLGLQNRIIRTV